MRRDPHRDPQPGDRFHHPHFAGGATMTIAKRGIRAGTSTPYVAPTYAADDGRYIEPRGRSLGLPIGADWTYLAPAAPAARELRDAIDVKQARGDGMRVEVLYADALGWRPEYAVRDDEYWRELFRAGHQARAVQP